MKKLEMHSESLINENIAKLAELFPECVTEVVNENNELEKQVDFDIFRSLFKDSIIAGNKERYQFTWPGKLAAREEAFIPTDRSLRPCKEESVNFDTTENLYIEGDNLTVLKLLRHTYHGKIKIIYIDPPYNTGNDFVYNDQFKQNKAAYDKISGEYDELGNRLYTNTAGGGHFHTNWLNMMYPRLLLARDLLSKNGVIFISIDDSEQANLLKICFEIFGERNFVSTLVWEKKKKGSFLSNAITNIKEYVLVFCKDKNAFNGLIGEINEDTETYPCINASNKRELRTIPAGIESKYKEKDYYLPSGTEISDTTMSIVLHSDLVIKNGYLAKDLVLEGNWRYSQVAMQQYAQANQLYITRDLYLRRIVSEPRTKTLKDILPRIGENTDLSHKDNVDILNLFTSGWGSNEDADEELRLLFGIQKIMDYPKPVRLIEKLIASYRDDTDYYVLDFFSGSATTAHAVMKLNTEDGGHRKFIMVQVPEKCDENSEAYKAGYKNICEIGKERIRRAGKQILNELNVKNEGSLFEDKAELDIGFRVFKQSDSMLADLSVKPEEAEQLTFKQMSSKIKNDRTPEDLLFYSMLELGVPLSEKIELLSINNHSIYKVENANLIACFDQEIDEGLVTEVAKMKPDYFILREDSIDDSLINNIDSIFKVYLNDTNAEDIIRIL